jgi:hypothetical protein
MQAASAPARWVGSGKRSHANLRDVANPLNDDYVRRSPFTSCFCERILLA